MRRLSTNRYEFAAGESVTMTISPEKGGNQVAAALDGNAHPVRRTADLRSLVEFPTNGDSHNVSLDCEFLHGDDPKAHYAVMLEGSRGGGVHFGGIIRRPTMSGPSLVNAVYFFTKP